MTPYENGRPLAEALGTPVAAISGASPTPNAYTESITLNALREADENATDGADGYVVVEVAGDVGGSTAREVTQ